jgi:hypothetical protein
LSSEFRNGIQIIHEKIEAKSAILMELEIGEYNIK